MSSLLAFNSFSKFFNISAEILGKTVIIFFVKISCIKSRLTMLISKITKTVLSKVFSDKLKIILIGDKILNNNPEIWQ